MKYSRAAKKINWFVFGLLGLALLSVGAYFWVIKLMDSAQSYRSPLANTAPTPGQTLGAPITRRVVIVLIDALRFDTATSSSAMPYLNEIRDRSATAIMHSQPPSFSAPAWTTILTGAWPDINDSQLFNPPKGTQARTFSQDDIFASAQRSGLRTAVSGYKWFEGMLSKSGVDAGFYTSGEDDAADIEVVNAALPWLTQDYQLVLIHLDQLDYSGHYQGGPLSPNWNAAARRIDNLLKAIVTQLDLSQDTLIVISDHGQIDRGGHGGPEPVTLIEPFIMTGAQVVPGKYSDMNMVDIAPTLAVLLGTNIPASNQGQVLKSMLTLTPEQDVAIQDALISQQSRLFTEYTLAIGSAVRIGEGESVSNTQTALIQARLARLGTERIWRNVIASFLGILPGYILYLRKERKNIWLFAGAVIYILLFNLRYAIMDGRTYSLASVESATWLITYTAITAAIALIVSWFVPMIGLHTFGAGPRMVAGKTLGYIWCTIYMLSLPILLSFALNGFFVTWTLPEYYTLYIGLLSLIQSMIVASVGLALIGMATLITWLAGRRVKTHQNLSK
jgi:hypothetical protein